MKWNIIKKISVFKNIFVNDFINHIIININNSFIISELKILNTNRNKERTINYIFRYMKRLVKSIVLILIQDIKINVDIRLNMIKKNNKS